MREQGSRNHTRRRSNPLVRPLASASVAVGVFSAALAGVFLASLAMPAESRAQAAPLLAAAGDIACDPSSPHFNRGRGHGRHCRQLATSRLLRNADRVLALGDNQYDRGTLRNYRRSYHRSWGRYRFKTRAVIGNHEYGPPRDANSRAKGYWDYFGRRRAGRRGKGWYSFDMGAWHIVVLNSHCRSSRRPTHMQPKVGCGRGSRQVRWLRRDLARNENKSCTLAAWHHPRFSSKSGGGFREVRPFWRELRAADADVVLSGHNHAYERFAQRLTGGRPSQNGIRQFVVGTGGKSLASPFRKVRPHSERRFRKFGVLKLRLRDDSYRWRFDRINGGRVLDRGTTTCN